MLCSPTLAARDQFRTLDCIAHIPTSRHENQECTAVYETYLYGTSPYYAVALIL